MRETVAIVGSHPRTRTEFDFGRENVDVWVFNEAAGGTQNWVKRADAVFQMHEPAIFRNPENRNDPKHYGWLKTQTWVPVYMQEQYPDIPMAVKYPLEELVERFSLRHFTSSVAYALALACFLGYKRIELYGVEMETNTEYQYQRDGVTLWIGVARGLGIEVDAHMGILNQPLYGYEGEVHVSYERFKERIAELNPDIAAATKEYQAALVNTNLAADAFERDASSENENRLFECVKAQVELGGKLGELDGRRQENMRYQVKADKMIEASQAFVFSRQEFETTASNLMKSYEQARTDFTVVGTYLSQLHQAARQAAKGSPKRAEAMKAYRQRLNAYLQTNNRMSILKGASAENYQWLDYLDKHIRAAGGEKSEAVLLERAMQNA